MVTASFAIACIAMVTITLNDWIRVYAYTSVRMGGTPFSRSTKPQALLMSSEWSSFQALDDDDDDLMGKIDTNEYAIEDDSQERKAEIGSSLKAPTIDRSADPIQVPAGKSNVRRNCVQCSSRYRESNFSTYTNLRVSTRVNRRNSSWRP
jgi:hypothetical protein